MFRWILAACMVLSATLSAQINVLAFSGSLRDDSVNKKLVLEAANFARQLGANVTVINLKDYPMPYYDQDLEDREGLPPKAREFRNLLIQNQIVIIASPEYNGSISGVLKNALDWASRDDNANPSRDGFQGKKFLLLSASPGKGGGTRGLVHLRAVIENIGGTVLATQVSVPNAYSAFNDQGQLKDAQLRMQLQQSVKAALGQ